MSNDNTGQLVNRATGELVDTDNTAAARSALNAVEAEIALTYREQLAPLLDERAALQAAVVESGETYALPSARYRTPKQDVIRRCTRCAQTLIVKEADGG